MKIHPESEKNDFKTGESVIVYMSPKPYTGTVLETEGDLVQVLDDENKIKEWEHFRQCRKITKPKVIWLRHDCECCEFDSYGMPKIIKAPMSSMMNHYVKFREVFDE